MRPKGIENLEWSCKNERVQSHGGEASAITGLIVLFFFDLSDFLESVMSR